MNELIELQKLVDELRSTNSKNDKLEILPKYPQCQELLECTYNPLKQYYIRNKSIDKVKMGNEPPARIPANIFGLLSMLTQRKITGSIAALTVQAFIILNKEHEALIRCIIDKDLKIGCGASTINKAFPNLIPTTPYMGAKSFDRKKVQKLLDENHRCYSQIKMDGRYVNAIVRNNISLVSRSGKPSGVGESLELAFEFLNNKICEETGNQHGTEFVFNGELVIPNVDRYTSNGMIASIVSMEEKRLEGRNISKEIAKFEKQYNKSPQEIAMSVKAVIWDFIPYDEYLKETWVIPYYVRFGILESVCKNNYMRSISLVESKEVTSMAEAMDHFQEMLERGEEGTILKTLEGIWKDGKPSHQYKMKLEMTVDLKVIGFNQGKAGTDLENTLGSFQCESSDEKLKSDPGGISRDIRDEVWANQEKYLGTIIEVKSYGLSHDRNNNYSLLHPSFNCLRDDKDTCDSLQDIQENENMVKGLTQ